MTFSMLSSFHSGEHESVRDEPGESRVARAEGFATGGFDALVDVRHAARFEVIGDEVRFPDFLWARIRGSLPEYPLSHACALAYVSDMGSGFGQTKWENTNGGPVIPHAIWFHEPVCVTD